VYEGPAAGHVGWPSKACTPAPHESRLFLLDQNDVQPLAHDRYVALARGEVAATEFAGRSFVLVDWYLRLDCGQPETVVNETCSWLVFDSQGSIDSRAAHAIDAPAVPTEKQWARVRALVFGDAVSNYT
jgi:hypothetical protein